MKRAAAKVITADPKAASVGRKSEKGSPCEVSSLLGPTVVVDKDGKLIKEKDLPPTLRVPSF